MSNKQNRIISIILVMTLTVWPLPEVTYALNQAPLESNTSEIASDMINSTEQLMEGIEENTEEVLIGIAGDTVYTAEPIEFFVGAADYDLLDGITAEYMGTDQQEMDVTIRDQGSFDIDRIGIYNITYEAVHEGLGESLIFSRTVSVKDHFINVRLSHTH